MGLGPKWHPKKELIDNKLETDNERDLFIVGQTIIERKVDEIMVCLLYTSPSPRD